MTDDELLQLLQDKLPEELTAAELQTLRARVRESAALQQALLQDLRFESHFAAAMGEFQLEPEKLAAAAELRRRRAERPWMLWATLLLILIGVGIVVWKQSTQPAEVAVVEPVEVVEKAEEKSEVKSKEEPEPATPPLANTAEKDVPATVLPGVNDATKTQAEKPTTPKITQPPKPWDEVLNLPAESLPKFSDVCFRGSDWRRKYLLRREELAPWFAAAPGERYELKDREVNKRLYGAIEGVARVQAPLPVDGGLRFSVSNYKRLQIHAYHGTQGITLLQHREDGRENWEAYATTRKPGTARPLTLMHTMGDEEHAGRAEFRYDGPIELRWHGGELFLLRGDVVLIRAPLAHAPDDIYLEGEMTYDLIELVRTCDFPFENTPVPADGQLFHPQSLPWNESLGKDAKVEYSAEQGVKLSGNHRDKRSLLFTPLPGIGLREVIFEVEQASPGFGVYLGGANGEPHHTARLAINKKTGRLCFVLRGPDEYREVTLDNFPERQEPISAPKLWIKLLHGAGLFYAWQSVDGVHWAIADRVEQNCVPSSTTLGIMAVKGDQPISGVVKSITVRELPELASLAPRALIEQAMSLPQENYYKTWLTKVTLGCPPQVDLNLWRRACAIRTLGDGCARALAHLLLEVLLDDPTTQALPREKQLTLLRETFYITSAAVEDYTLPESPIERVLKLGLQDPQGHYFSSVRRFLMDTPTWSSQKVAIHKSTNLERELLYLLLHNRPQEVLELCQVMRFYHFDFERPLLAWAETTASRQAGKSIGKIKEMKEDWLPTFTESLSKEVYNFTADLEALMENQAVADAARMVTALEGEPTGLTLVAGDPDWFVSLHGAAELALKKFPQLRDELKQRAGKLAALRIQQAIAAADADALRLATLQFADAPEVAVAHDWLGDRALQLGWFSGAFTEFKAAEKIAESRQQAIYHAKARLAAAMMGDDYQPPVTETVRMGEVSYAAADFETLVREMLERDHPRMQYTAENSVQRVPAPSSFKIKKLSRIDGPAGQKPEEDGAREIGYKRIDYAGRQISAQIFRDRVYTGNRFHLGAIDLHNGQLAWNGETPRGEPRLGQAWPLIPMRPLVTQDFVFVRMLYGPLPCFCCYERSSGKLLWQQESTEQRGYASDPFFFQGELMIVGMAREQNGYRLTLQRIDPQTGDPLFERTLTSLRRGWESRHGCEVAQSHEDLLILCTGLLLQCDGQGNVAWARKSLVTPAWERPEWVRQHFATPLVVGERVFVLSPGMERVECCDVNTGRLVWQFMDDYPWRVIGTVDEVVIVETEAGFVGLNVADGSVVWRHEETNRRLHALGFDGERLLYFTHAAQENRETPPVAVWLDPRRGQVLGKTSLHDLKHKDPRVGPLVALPDRWWLLAGREREPQRDVFELIPEEPISRWANPTTRDSWCVRLPSDLVEDCEQRLPGWQLVSTHPENRPVDTEWYGEKQVVALGARQDLPLVLTQTSTLPAATRVHLQMRVGHDPGQEGTLRILFGQELVFAQPLNATTQQQRWQSLEIDLTPFAGQTGTLILHYQPTNGGEQQLWFGSLRLLEKSAKKVDE